MKNDKGLFEFNQLEALEQAVRITKKAAAETIASTREAHHTAYGAYHYLAKRFNEESTKYVELVSVCQ